MRRANCRPTDDHVPVDITELLDRAAHDAMRVYPDLDVSLVPAPTVIIVGLPAGLRLAVDNAIANAVKHGGATRVQLSAVSSRAGVEIAIDDDGVGVPRGGTQGRVRAVLPRVDGVALGLGARAWRWSPSRPNCTAAQRHWRTARWAVHGCCCGCPGLASASVSDLALPVSEHAQQVDDENQGLSRQAVPAACGAVGLLGRDDEFAAAADLHPGNAVLPALDQTAQRELDRLAAIPGTVELLARVVLDADIVHLDVPPGTASAPSPTTRSSMTSSVGAGPSGKSISGFVPWAEVTRHHT